MDDTISRAAAIDAMCDACSDWCDEGVCKKVSAIQKLPSAQPKMIRGHWRVTPMACYGGGTMTEYECSKCEGHQITVSNFCPNCGAKMEGAKE